MREGDNPGLVSALIDTDYIFMEGQLQIEGIQSTEDFNP